MSTPKGRTPTSELLNYKKGNREELVEVAVELVEDPSYGVQVRVPMESNVVKWSPGNKTSAATNHRACVGQRLQPVIRIVSKASMESHLSIRLRVIGPGVMTHKDMAWDREAGQYRKPGSRPRRTIFL